MPSFLMESRCVRQWGGNHPCTSSVVNRMHLGNFLAQLASGTTASVKGFGCRPLGAGADAGLQAGAGVRNPPGEETAGRRGALSRRRQFVQSSKAR